MVYKKSKSENSKNAMQGEHRKKRELSFFLLKNDIDCLL